LDILYESLTKNFGDDEINSALDILDLKQGYEGEFAK